jgi:lambda repressor-like predicted transcriptional regulator
MTTDPTPLGRYILKCLKRKNLSMRQASLDAGLAPETVSQVIRRGKTSTPRPDTLRLIADAIDGNYHQMMVLANYVDLPRGLDAVPSEQREVVFHLLSIWAELEELDPSGDSLRRLLTVITTQADAFRAAMRAVERHQADERREQELSGGD